jgi:hypothetical protein
MDVTPLEFTWTRYLYGTDYPGLEVQMVKSLGVYGDYIARKRMNSTPGRSDSFH